MAGRARTEAEYNATILCVLSYIQTHLDDELTPHQLADIACFSQHHFHRVFRSIVGESVMDHIRRLRLERAAYQLKTSEELVGMISLEAGFQAQECFTRSFQSYYGLAPIAYRNSPIAYLLPSACGVHFSPEGFTSIRRTIDSIPVDPADLCPFHRAWADEADPNLDRAIEALASLADFVYPSHSCDPCSQTGWENMTANTIDIDKEIDDIQHEVEAAKLRLTEARSKRPRELVQDYVLQDTDGMDVRLAELFGSKNDLILVHNMGTGCSYCTMWADGFTGIAPHLSDRAAFIVCSPDKPEVQKRFAASRNWPFKMVSAHDSSVFRDMGFWQDAGQHPGPWPGVSTFHKDPDGKIYRIAKSTFGPGDDFCAVWSFLDMLQDGPNNWAPKYTYGEKQ